MIGLGLELRLVGCFWQIQTNCHHAHAVHLLATRLVTSMNSETLRQSALWGGSRVQPRADQGCHSAPVTMASGGTEMGRRRRAQGQGWSSRLGLGKKRAGGRCDQGGGAGAVPAGLSVACGRPAPPTAAAPSPTHPARTHTHTPARGRAMTVNKQHTDGTATPTFRGGKHRSCARPWCAAAAWGGPAHGAQAVRAGLVIGSPRRAERAADQTGFAATRCERAHQDGCGCGVGATNQKRWGLQRATRGRRAQRGQQRGQGQGRR